jgi:hypothetical protein
MKNYIVRQYDQLLEGLFLDETTINKIKENIDSDRVTKLLIEAIYTITDVAYDYPSLVAIESLITAAKHLIKDISSYDNKARGFVRFNYVAYCLYEAEILLRATRQRLSGLPQTREASRLPFELPPPGVRIFIESCEFVIHSILDMFSVDDYLLSLNLNYNYVIIDTVDTPKHSICAIFIPEHRLKDYTVYIAISHESLHGPGGYIINNIYLKEPILKDFIEKGRILSYETTQKERGKIIEEAIVEILDLEFSYLGNFDLYMEEEWSFFSNYFAGALKYEIEHAHIIHYFLRTFLTRLYISIIDKSDWYFSKASMRKLIKDHLTQIKKILGAPFDRISHILSASLIIGVENDIEDNYKLINVVFNELSSFINKYINMRNKLKDYYHSIELSEMTDKIINGEVINKEIKYPHLMIQQVNTKLKDKSINGNLSKPDIDRITTALIMSLWNGHNQKKADIKRSQKGFVEKADG